MEISFRIAAATLVAALLGGQNAGEPSAEQQRIQKVIDHVEKACLERTVYMIGPSKAKRLAELVRQRKPRLVVECGTAIGYSGLWIARELKAAGSGRLITFEINPERAKEAEEHFRAAGLDDLVSVQVGDARQLVRTVREPVDFLFIDCGYSNYLPCLTGIKDQLAPGAIVVADNVGIGSSGMSDYLEFVRNNYRSRTEWFDTNLPWADRDAMEVSVVPENSP